MNYILVIVLVWLISLIILENISIDKKDRTTKIPLVDLYKEFKYILYSIDDKQHKNNMLIYKIIVILFFILSPILLLSYIKSEGI